MVVGSQLWTSATTVLSLLFVYNVLFLFFYIEYRETKTPLFCSVVSSLPANYAFFDCLTSI